MSLDLISLFDNDLDETTVNEESLRTPSDYNNIENFCKLATDHINKCISSGVLTWLTMGCNALQ